MFHLVHDVILDDNIGVVKDLMGPMTGWVWGLKPNEGPAQLHAEKIQGASEQVARIKIQVEDGDHALVGGIEQWVVGEGWNHGVEIGIIAT